MWLAVEGVVNLHRHLRTHTLRTSDQDAIRVIPATLGGAWGCSRYHDFTLYALGSPKFHAMLNCTGFKIKMFAARHGIYVILALAPRQENTAQIFSSGMVFSDQA